jgi:trimeric autotransporter adhesin
MKVILLCMLMLPVLGWSQNTSPFWSLNGNNNATLSHKVGTTNDVSLRLVTNNLERMKIHSTGSIGIGISSTPAARLHINGFQTGNPFLVQVGTAAAFLVHNNRGVSIATLTPPPAAGLRVGTLVIHNKGTENTFVGESSGTLHTTGSSNSAVGFQALYSSLTGNNNIAVGASALYANSSGSNNTAVGPKALTKNSTGFSNIAIGGEALRENSTGFYNIAVGSQSLLYNNGSGNVAIGLAALPFLTTGRYNVGVGSNALYRTTTAEYNTAIGSLAANSYNNGYNNVFVGANTDVNGPDYYNVVVIGQGTIGTAPSQVTIGNSATRSYRAYAGWSNISDGRFKENVKEEVPGLTFINKLRPVTYQLKATDLEKHLHGGQSNGDELGGNAKVVMEKALREKEALIHTGFVAQEVERAAKDLDYTFSGIEAPVSEKDVYGLKYSEFVVPLTKAVQELSEKNNRLEEEMEELKRIVLQLTSDANNSSRAWIKQNTPNPVSGSTMIQYFIPQQARSALIFVTDAKGRQLKIYKVAGAGVVNFSAATLPSGTYNYSLVVDGKNVSSKKLVVAR